ncbi:MAG: thioredoxin family protein [Patescibacteria group bacterium]
MKFLLILTLTMVMISGCQWFGAQPETEPVVQTTTEETTEAPENYQPYSQDALTQALENQQRVILFFKASWCPTCREAEQDILINGRALPEDVLILHADYDTETDLKDRYGVVTQHTFVLVNQQQLAAETWVGGGVERILSIVGAPEQADLVDDALL